MSEVTATILQQLGGGKFIMMTGANKLTAKDNTLSFRLPGAGGFCKDGINYVAITLTVMDVYEIQFCRTRGAKLTLVEARNDVYAEDLRTVFSEVTGLAVAMPRLVSA